MITLTRDPDEVLIQSEVQRSQMVTLLDEMIAGINAAPLRPVASSASNVNVVAGDIGKLFLQTATSTIGLLAAATAGNGFTIYVQASGGAVTLDPNSSEQINGAATLVLSDGAAAMVTCTGTAWRALVITTPASLGSAAQEDVGTAIGNVLQLVDVGGVAGLPAVSGANLTDLPGEIGGSPNAATRSANTSYQNNQSKTIEVTVDVESSTNAAIFLERSVDNSTWIKMAGREQMNNSASLVMTTTVPAGWYWRVTVSAGTATINSVTEFY